VRFLLDECCAPALAQALRSAGHDVRHALEDLRGSDDEALIALAVQDERVVVTEDKDFGELVMRHGRALPGLILLRIEPRDRHLKARRLLALLARDETGLIGSYAVVEVASIRLRPLPISG
jgi:predicted nuclease of predicted toxin-antitoxin system